ncbi:amino acid ABC transporter permease [Pusillimonas sp. ANT_WB101]|uniref:amino acid ABC transporter permease n=1 Tax=Pusillimonas sp. ANT_WB101 TaxID=2597356 RepID=UPI0011EBB849|nr:amino acid ABC transporter permease [Pusillimonas sp. ANT_WB101]KAA0892773.1 amino acid ABC transporter permease [Pusillimonas sp. ANT_WB101]
MRELSVTDLWTIVLAARWTLALAAIALTGGAIGGLIVALARTSPSKWLIVPARTFIMVFQGTPLLMQLFLVFFGFPVLGITVNPWIAAGVALILNTSAFLGDIWRGCIEAVPAGQVEAANALNLSTFHRLKDVILPQAAKIAVPPTVGFMVQIIKGTSLTAIIGFSELTRTAQIINNSTFSPMPVFALVAFIYFCICWPLSKWSRRLERRLSASLR